MNKLKIAALIGVLSLSALSCGLLDRFTGSIGGASVTSELWSDVPRMDGAEASELEMPLFVRLLMQTMMSQALAGEEANADWIVFTLSGDPQDIQDFYTAERMSSHGWDASDASPCFSGGEEGVEQVGLICVFDKQTGEQGAGLIIMAAQGEASGETNAFFIRFEYAETPTE